MNEWHVAKAGYHPFVQNVEVKKQGIAVQVRELINDIVDLTPDIKPKDILLTLQKKRKKNQVLDRENKINKIKDSNFSPKKHPNPDYLFHKDLLPTLRQVNTYFTHLCK